MKYIIAIALLISVSANAWEKKAPLPDATPDQCKALGKSFVKHSVRKNGVQVRAFCRGKVRVQS